MTIQEQKREYITGRISELCAQGMSKAEIARRLGILPQSLNNILSGTRGVSDRFFSSFQDTFRTDSHSPAPGSATMDPTGKASISGRFVDAVQYALASGLAGSKAEIAEALGVLPSKLSEVLNERMMAGADMLARMCLSYGISAAWLLTGDGEMLQDSKALQTAERLWSQIDFLSEQIREKDRQIQKLLAMQTEGK